jgi:DNA-binding PadR family transcriptional regulator
MSTTRLLILGLIRWLEPVHGYQVRRELLSWGVEDWANVAPGSIYHALRKLTAEGMLHEVGTEQVGARPARTTYRTTPAGREEFLRLLRKSWWEHRPPADPFLGAMSFLPSLSRREAVAALRNRAAVLRGEVAQLTEMATEVAEAGEKPPHVGWSVELMAARAEVEIAWCERVARRVEAGEGMHEGDPSGSAAQVLARWRGSLEREAAGAEPPPAGRTEDPTE